MTSNILDLVHQRQMETKMAKAKLNQPVREVANIVWQYNGCDTTQVVRYTDMKAAEKDYNKLLQAADHGKAIVLTGPCMTCTVRFPQNMVHCYLIVVEDNNFLQADSQKRFQAMMQQ